VVLNLKTAPGREAFERLARQADVLVESYRPGVMAELGLDYPRLSAANPRLVYASVSGYGQTGPDAQKGGFDLIAQGISGLMSVTGSPGGPPVKCGIPVTDLGAGLFLLGGVMVALYDRGRTGRGQWVDTSLLEAGIALSVWEATQFFSGGGIPAPAGSAHRMGAPYQAFRCSDGYLTIGAWSDRLFARLCRALGHPEWIERPEYATSPARVSNRDALAAAIEAITGTRTRREWQALLDAHDIPCGPINNYEEALSDPQVLARGMVVRVEHPVLGPMDTLGPALKFSDTPAAAARPAPRLGEHTDAVLRGIGYSDAEIGALRDAGAIG
jgi:formyl-CoA transferase